MKKGSIVIYCCIVVGILWSVFACQEKKAEVPKPKGYFRIDLPPHSYQVFDTSALPFQFQYSQSAFYTIEDKGEGIQWIHLYYPQQQAVLEMTYLPVDTNLPRLMENDEEFVGLHYSMASDVEESFIQDDSAKLYGKLFDIAGKNVACPLQFWLTDKTHHYLRTSLYFNFTPNNDSIQPVIEYIREDVMKMIETFEWR